MHAFCSYYQQDALSQNMPFSFLGHLVAASLSHSLQFSSSSENLLSGPKPDCLSFFLHIYYFLLYLLSQKSKTIDIAKYNSIQDKIMERLSRLSQNILQREAQESLEVLLAKET